MRRPAGFQGETYSALQPEISPKERNRTRRATANAILSGKLIRPNECQHCGRPDRQIDAHHPDYRDPMNVMWLCRWCHSAEHRRISEDAGTEREEGWCSSYGPIRVASDVAFGFAAQRAFVRPETITCVPA